MSIPIVSIQIVSSIPVARKSAFFVSKVLNIHFNFTVKWTNMNVYVTKWLSGKFYSCILLNCTFIKVPEIVCDFHVVNLWDVGQSRSFTSLSLSILEAEYIPLLPSKKLAFLVNKIYIFWSNQWGDSNGEVKWTGPPRLQAIRKKNVYRSFKKHKKSTDISLFFIITMH